MTTSLSVMATQKVKKHTRIISLSLKTMKKRKKELLHRPSHLQNVHDSIANQYKHRNVSKCLWRKLTH